MGLVNGIGIGLECLLEREGLLERLLLGEGLGKYVCEGMSRIGQECPVERVRLVRILLKKAEGET